ncbi:GAF and ANTAR domain-containing protein [Actinomadura sp. DC4]|uniref:GAF and ANTAR domain-containing protein n=1 Tax=Actinomadura sp. DC4 TaxID=3055069 RepID=UPI0025B16C4E|nr:GAF and ANTAR domain-containing protein [Actinomadura sp. DC4]MDN3354516.1 GAF and ANTAR domain-containing protein [Actinomadura sp. DC4]
MAVDRIRLAGALADIVADPPGTADIPERLCRACRAALPVDGVGLSLMPKDRPDGRVLVGASDERGARIEEWQFGFGEGPCVSAFVAGRPVLVPDLQTHEAQLRWPMFTWEAEGSGVAAVFAFPLQIGVIGIGVLDCYRARAGPLEEIAEALAVTDAVTVALLNIDVAGGEDEVALFDLSWRTHAVVHQATGALAADLGISVGEALARLRGHAFGSSRPLEEVAEEVLTGRLRLAR